VPISLLGVVCVVAAGRSHASESPIMKAFFILSIACLGVFVMESNSLAADESTRESAAATPLNQEMETLDGKKVNLAKKYKDKVVLLVNVASKCGYTPQYEQLQALHEKYADQGLAIVGVPCNQFGKQEPGTAAEISQFCQENYGVQFDLLAKVDVNGSDAAPLYKYLTSKETNPKFAGNIKWNFEKFLFNRNGQLVARYESKVKPDAREVVEAIERELAKE
jgi:glutathione peroxidase